MVSNYIQPFHVGEFYYPRPNLNVGLFKLP